jgi:hypothetical protein
VLNFGHCEFADTKQARTGRDLIAEGAADLGGGEGDTSIIILE